MGILVPSPQSGSRSNCGALQPASASLAATWASEAVTAEVALEGLLAREPEAGGTKGAV